MLLLPGACVDMWNCVHVCPSSRLCIWVIMSYVGVRGVCGMGVLVSICVPTCTHGLSTLLPPVVLGFLSWFSLSLPRRHTRGLCVWLCVPVGVCIPL